LLRKNTLFKKKKFKFRKYGFKKRHKFKRLSYLFKRFRRRKAFYKKQARFYKKSGQIFKAFQSVKSSYKRFFMKRFIQNSILKQTNKTKILINSKKRYLSLKGGRLFFYKNKNNKRFFKFFKQKVKKHSNINFKLRNS